MFRADQQYPASMGRGRLRVAVFVVILINLMLVLEPAGSGFAAAVVTSQAPRLTLEEVIKMVQAGESEDAVIKRIRSAKRPFDLTEAEKTELRQLRVNDTIIKYLVNPDLDYTTPPPSAAPAVVPPPEFIYPNDPFASKVPPGVGLYLLQKSDLVPIDVKSLIPEKQGGILAKVLPVLNQKLIGVLPGVASRVRVEMTPAVFYLRLAEPMKIEDITLVAMDIVSKTKQRQLEFAPAPQKGAKPVVKTAASRQSDRTAVGPRLYRVVTTMLGTGEFMFYFGGSADPAAGIQGKGYDFGVN